MEQLIVGTINICCAYWYLIACDVVFEGAAVFLVSSGGSKPVRKWISLLG
jgi:hypothetical protein